MKLYTEPRDGKFELDENKLYKIANVSVADWTVVAPKMLEVLDDKENSAGAAIIFFEYHKDLPPMLASRKEIWAYLCLKGYFTYARKKLYNKRVTPESLATNYFGDLSRNPLADLWWSVYISYDPDHIEDPYWLTKLFFKNNSFRTRNMSTLLREKNVLLGMLEFFYDHSSGDNAIELSEERGTFIAKYFNRLSKIRQLGIFTREEIKQKCEDIKDIIRGIKNREDSRKAAMEIPIS